MFDESSEYYDLIYGSWKDYKSESVRLATIIRDRRPAARTVLDVACGTGRHAEILGEDGFQVDGLDINADFVRIASERSPDGRFVQVDMTDFSLGRRYDAVLCLFSSIAYVRSVENLRETLSCFERHLTEDGVVVVEPFFTPDAWREGQVGVNVAEGSGTKVCRMSRSSRDDGIAILEFEYLIGRPDAIERMSEVHEVGLFTHEDMMDAFEGAGFRAMYDGEGLMGRGLYVAERS